MYELITQTSTLEQRIHLFVYRLLGTQGYVPVNSRFDDPTNPIFQSSEIPYFNTSYIRKAMQAASMTPQTDCNGADMMQARGWKSNSRNRNEGHAALLNPRRAGDGGIVPNNNETKENNGRREAAAHGVRVRKRLFLNFVMTVRCSSDL